MGEQAVPGEESKGSRRREGQSLDPRGGRGYGDALHRTPGLEADAGPHLKQGRAGRRRRRRRWPSRAAAPPPPARGRRRGGVGGRWRLKGQEPPG